MAVFIFPTFPYGKLSEYVSLTKTETITGAKTFTADINFNDTNSINKLKDLSLINGKTIFGSVQKYLTIKSPETVAAVDSVLELRKIAGTRFISLNGSDIELTGGNLSLNGGFSSRSAIIADENFDARLNTVVPVDGTTAAATKIYTVPAGKTMSFTKMQIPAFNQTGGAFDSVTVSVGSNAPACDNYMPITKLGHTANTQIVTFAPAINVPYSFYVENEEIYLKVTTASTNTTHEIGVIVFGWLFS